MRVPAHLASAFDQPFEDLIARFAVEQGLMPELEALHSNRFLARSVVPHIEKLSSLFNREERDQSGGLDKYWRESSNPANLRLAYFLYFMPCNLYRMAGVWSELARLGFQWRAGPSLRGIEFGAGPASGACGIAAGERHSPIGIPAVGDWALIEQDKAMLELGTGWAGQYFAHEGHADWGTRPFHRTLDLSKSLLPRNAPRFNIWLMSFFLNETLVPPAELAANLLDAWDRHLEDEGVAILVEPALKLQSRKILALRAALIAEADRRGLKDIQVLLPCLGHQACGALAAEEDWCHEEVMWWRPPYFRKLDTMAGLDRKTLPFSYLVVAKSRRTREQILPGLADSAPASRYRLVSPAFAQGKELEFFVCGQDGKRRARYRPNADTPASPEGTNDIGKLREDEGHRLQRGDLLLGAEIRGDVHASRVQSVKKIG